MSDERTKEELIRQLDTLAYWANECSLALLVRWSYTKTEIAQRDKDIMHRLSDIVKDVEAQQPPEPELTPDEMEQTRKIIVGALDQRENRERIAELEAELERHRVSDWCLAGVDTP